VQKHKPLAAQDSSAQVCLRPEARDYGCFDELFCDILFQLLFSRTVLIHQGSMLTCADAQALGNAGLISSDTCSIVQDNAQSPCGCIDQDEPCSICLPDQTIGTPNGLIPFKGGVISCANAQDLANEGVPPADCLVLQNSNSVCGCVDETTETTSPMPARHLGLGHADNEPSADGQVKGNHNNRPESCQQTDPTDLQTPTGRPTDPNRPTNRPTNRPDQQAY
jgi:hypothetical protein